MKVTKCFTRRCFVKFRSQMSQISDEMFHDMFVYSSGLKRVQGSKIENMA